MPVQEPPSSSNPYVKVANAPGLYRHAKTGAYYAVKKFGGKRKERSLGTADRKIAERRLKEWIDNFAKVDSGVEKTTVRQLVAKFEESSRGFVRNTQVTTHAIIKSFQKFMGHDFDMEVRKIRPSQLDEWLASEEPRLRNTTYNRYAGFLKQLFELATKDRIIPESPAKVLRTPWKRPQDVQRICPTFTDQFPKIVESIRSQPFSDHAQDSADFIEFMGKAGLGQAEVSNVRWGDILWSENQIRVRRCKTDTVFFVPIYPHLRPFLERLKKQRGAMFPNALIFKIKDAKKALTSACKRLGYPHFTQRSLRQSLIVHMLRSGVHYKFVALAQGHRDGGTLVNETYSQVIAENDDAWAKAQLAKLAMSA